MKSSLASVLLISFLISINTVCAFDNKKPTLIIFHADWCKYCDVAKKDIDNDPNLSEEVKKYDVVLANFDVDKDLVEGYHIKTIPTFVIVDGRKTRFKVGYTGPNDLLKFIK
jgi:thioredoxin-related protein